MHAIDISERLRSKARCVADLASQVQRGGSVTADQLNTLALELDTYAEHVATVSMGNARLAAQS
jgi:hypothetical protein